MSFYGKKSIKVSYHLAQFGGYRHCGSGNIMVLGFYLISQEQMIKFHVTLWLRALQGKSPSSVSIGTVVGEIK